MYNLNLLSTRTLITAPEVLRQIPTREGLQEKNVIDSIQIAEERFILGALGWDLYHSLCAQKNVVVDNSNKATLQAKFIEQYGADAPMLENGQVVNAAELLTPDNLTLWYDKLWKVTAECVRFICLPVVYAMMENAGIMKNNPAVPIPDINTAGARSESVSLGELKFMMQSALQDRVNPALDALQQYLCMFSAKYPLFNTAKCPQQSCHGNGGSAPRKNNGWITSIYPDD